MVRWLRASVKNLTMVPSFSCTVGRAWITEQEQE